MGLPLSVVAAGRRIFTLGHDDILELQVASGGGAIRKVASDATSIGPLLSASDGVNVVRMDSTGLTALVFHSTSGVSQLLNLRSPELTAKQATRSPSEVLISHVLARANGELWLVHGRLNIHVGIPVTMFDSSGGLLGSALVAVPRFEELRRAVTGNPPMGNPTGHMVNNRMVLLGDRLVMADATAGRCAWFSVSKLEASR
jgi:hypothetical protein